MKEIEKHACRKLLKSYEIVEHEDEELIEPIEDDDVLTTHMEIVHLLKNDHKRKINDTREEYFYINCKFIFGSATRVERF